MGRGRDDVLLRQQRAGMIRMDLATLKAKTLEETNQFFLENVGYVPDQDSDEWEDEYRRRFAVARARPKAALLDVNVAPEVPAPTAQRAIQKAELPELRGPAAAVRWATTLRAERLKEIQNKEMGIWLAHSWTAAKSWIDTRELPAAAFLRRVERGFAEDRRQVEERAVVLQAQRKAKADADTALADQIQAAGITAQGLIELVDISPRTKAMPARAKLAELKADDRRMRVFDTTHPSALLVLESGATRRIEYGIERDDGLVADLKLFAQTMRP
jgi:hypothetical protein